MRTTTGLALLGLLTVAGCARTAAPGGPAADPDPPTDTASVAADYAGRFRTVTTVLESPQHGPQLCDVVATSYPPQCGGPDVLGWDWSTVTAESANGTTWGSYLLVGTWDGAAFTLTEPAAVDDGSAHPQAEVDFSAPCPEPAGGWRPVEPGRTTEANLQAAMTMAQGDDGFAGLWVDQRGRTDNDPQQLVLVVRTTGDVAELQAELRRLWGGALCVTGARFTEAELLAAQVALRGEPGVTSSAPDTLDNVLDVSVFVATEQRQREFDSRFGSGMIRQTGLLQPLD